MIALVAVDNLTGVSARRLRTRLLITIGDLILQALIIVLGFVLVFDPHDLTASIHLGTAPSWSDLAFALPIAVIAFTGIEAAASIAGEVSATPQAGQAAGGPGLGGDRADLRRDLARRRRRAPGSRRGDRARHDAHQGAGAGGGRGVPSQVARRRAQVRGRDRGRAGAVRRGRGRRCSASRGSGYSLATNRQIPSAVGRLHGRWGTPYVIIGAAAIAAAALVLPTDLEFLVGIYAFGALLAFTIAHVSVIALRFRERDRDAPVQRAAVDHDLGRAVCRSPRSSARSPRRSAGWRCSCSTPAPATSGWPGCSSGLVLYVGYRKSQQKPLLKRVTIPERALRYEALEPEFGSILVPILGTALDDDIVQTAGRLAGETRDDLESEGAVIEAIWVFEIPLALPMDAPLPEAQVKRAREALARAKLVGEEYEGVEVATAIVRARRAGEAIVREARRRGVEAIVLAAEESSRVRGGSLFGGVGGPLENYVGDVSRYVIAQGAVPRDPDRAAGRLARPSHRAGAIRAGPGRRGAAVRSGDGRSRAGPSRRVQARALMAERRLEGLQRVLGVYPLASSAYGNVGSSIYYALGLVAALALGLTPIVFIISGFIFFLTASTYAEATAMFPEAGGSSIVRAARVQRVLVVLRGVGADAQLHADDRDVSVLRPALHRGTVLAGARASTGRRDRRDRGDRRARRDQHPRRRGVDRRQPGARGDRLLHPGADRDASAWCWCSRRRR